VLAVAVIAYIIRRKRHTCSRSVPEEQDTTTDKQAVLTNDSINNNNTNSNSGAFSRAAVTDNPRRNSSDRKSGSMLIDLDSGVVIGSVHDVTTTNDDIEHGTSGANHIDSDNIKGIDNLEQATSKTTAAVDDTAATSVTQYKTSVPNEIDITATTTDGVTNDTTTATDTATHTTLDTAARAVVAATVDLATHTNATTATDNSEASAIQQASNEATDIGSSESATVATKKPFWTKRIGQASRLVTTRMSTATQAAVAAHGDKAIVAYELVGAIAQHVPYIKTAYGLCNEIVQLFGAGVHIDSNCAEVVAWAKHMQVCYHIHIYTCIKATCFSSIWQYICMHMIHLILRLLQVCTSHIHVRCSSSIILYHLYICMNVFVSVCYTLQQSTLDTLQGHIEAYPASGADINLSLMDKVNATLTELKSLAVKHQSSNMLTKFALSRKTQSLLNEATQCFTEATSKLHLNIAVSQYGLNLHIDEGVSILVR
jgi:hypothetical protein